MSDEIFAESEEFKAIKDAYHEQERIYSLVLKLEKEYSQLKKQFSGEYLKYTLAKTLIEHTKMNNALQDASEKFYDHACKYPQYKHIISSIMDELELSSYEHQLQLDKLVEAPGMDSFKSIIKTAEENYQALKSADIEYIYSVDRYSIPEYRALVEAVGNSVKAIKHKLRRFEPELLACFKKHANEEFREYYNELSEELFS